MTERIKGFVGLRSHDQSPILELREPNGTVIDWPFRKTSADDDGLWQAWPNVPLRGSWQFRVRLRNGRHLCPADQNYFESTLHSLWIHEDQLFDYQPAAEVAPSKVEKIDPFDGRLSTRPLYIYLPRGYDNHPEKTYPVLYMHDGQNVFEAFAGDSYAGSWRADEVADRLIAQARLPEIIIVGVSHGEQDRIKEYLPPYSHFPSLEDTKDDEESIQGEADKTAGFYTDDVATYVGQNYRIAEDRSRTATCGSSMGGLFSLYLAWERPEFARNHAAMSPSIWATKNQDQNFKIVDRMGLTEPPDIRVWIDSGTFAAERQGNDGQAEVKLACEKLLEIGFAHGENLQHYLDRDADHSEASWSRRLDKVLLYLFPIRNDASD